VSESPSPDQPAPPDPRNGLLDGVRSYLRPATNGARTPADVAAEATLLRVHLLATLGRLTSDLAHDFSNLMTVMLGYGELFEAVTPADLPGRPYLDQIFQAAERASVLTRRLLDFCRHVELDRPTGPADAGEVVRTGGALLAHLLRRRVEVHVEADDTGPVRADARQIEQVLVNLVLNARDALPKGGRVDVGTAPFRADAPFTHALGTTPAGAYVRLRVSDHGCGMDEAVCARALTPFFTTKPNGIGLGLAVVARIVRACRGAVTIQSAPGAGTTVDVFFPTAE
jgi:two-component system, cell cycle sensor histidine kinase and response regulator CckA